MCSQLFRILFRTMNYQYDYTFDWTILRQRKQHMEAGAAAADRRSPSVQRRAQQQPSQPPPNNEVRSVCRALVPGPSTWGHRASSKHCVAASYRINDVALQIVRCVSASEISTMRCAAS